MNTGEVIAGGVAGGTILGLSLGMIQGIVGITAACIMLAGSVWYIIAQRKNARANELKAKAFEKQAEYFEKKLKKEGLDDE